MVTVRSSACALVVVAVVSLGLSTVVRDDRAQAQLPAPAAAAAPAVGRFQVSAYATPADGQNAGCYIVDTATGEVWHTRLGAGLVEVSEQSLVER